MTGHLNRVVNAEHANLRRAVTAARRQLDDIEALERRGGLSTLPRDARRVAAARRRAPEATFSELATRLDLSRSRVQRAFEQIGSAALHDRQRHFMAMNHPRPVVIAGNWKMNTTPLDASLLANDIAAATDVRGVMRVICPPFVCASSRSRAHSRTPMSHVGVQNIHAQPFGAYTGEISAPMIVGLATWAIIGHSERRRDQGEDDVLIGRKLLRCAEFGLRPILCVGEQLDDRRSGRAEATVRGQLERTLSMIEGAAALIPDDLVVAYEPVWAIGTGLTARGSDAAQMAQLIRQTLAEHGVPNSATHVPVLYGGSVTSATIDEFLAEPDIDGALVGGASLKVDEMAGIVARAGLTAEARAAADNRS